MADEKNQHAGHRQRMLKRYLEHGIDGFEDHEILEIFLFTAYSRRNTNDISRALIERFGSLEGVLNAGYDQLKEEKNVGDTAAALISFMKDFARKFSGTDLAGRKCAIPGRCATTSSGCSGTGTRRRRTPHSWTRR